MSVKRQAYIAAFRMLSIFTVSITARNILTLCSVTSHVCIVITFQACIPNAFCSNLEHGAADPDCVLRSFPQSLEINFILAIPVHYGSFLAYPLESRQCSYQSKLCGLDGQERRKGDLLAACFMLFILLSLVDGGERLYETHIDFRWAARHRMPKDTETSQWESQAKFVA
jgi:hypothetical protein